MTTTVGIQDLQEHAGEYVRRVRAGETIVVTEAGEPAVEMRPVAARDSFQRMLEEGRIRAPKHDLHELLQKNPPLPHPPGKAVSEILREMREEER